MAPMCAVGRLAGAPEYRHAAVLLSEPRFAHPDSFAVRTSNSFGALIHP
jgi:hypothetical protein